MRREYDLDFQSMRPNRFAKRLEGKSVTVVVLDEDVARVFPSSKVVNDLLRAVIKGMPSTAPRPSQPRRRAR